MPQRKAQVKYEAYDNLQMQFRAKKREKGKLSNIIVRKTRDGKKMSWQKKS